MPNWCANHLSCSGDRSAIASFLGKATRRDTFVTEVLTAASNIDPNHVGNITRAVLESFAGNADLSFDGHVPEPDPVGDDWYEWRIKNWGTKWDANHPILESLELLDNGSSFVAFSFETAWGPPDVWFEKTAKTHPELEFRMVWNEEQGFGGLFTASGGDVHQRDMEWSELVTHWTDAPYSPLYGDEDPGDAGDDAPV